MDSDYSLKNVSKNASTRQIIGFSLAGIVIVALSLILIGFLVGGQPSDKTGDDGESERIVSRDVTTDGNGDEIVVVTKADENGNTKEMEIRSAGDGKVTLSEPQVDEFGNDVRVEKTVDGDIQSVKAEIIVSTEYNEEHSYTLKDYLPWTYYDYLEDGSSVDMYYEIAENTAVEKGIVITVSGCSEVVNKSYARDYLNSLDVDLSGYEIVYRVRDCGM